MSHWQPVCRVSDLIPNAGVAARVGDQQIALFYLADTQQLYALSNFDPVGKANVIARSLVGDSAGVPIVISPLYKQHYRLNDGVCLEDNAVMLTPYPARINGQQVEVQCQQVMS